MRARFLGFAMLAIGLLVQAVAAQDQLGVVAAVQPQATGGIGNARVMLIRGSELREGETVVTGANGEVQVVFSDETHLVIGRGSSLVIERYLLRSDGTPQKFAVNALAGTFRFITGKGDKNAYSIATPTGTMGVRGTEFDFTVEKVTGMTSVILFEGGVRLCAFTGECVELTRPCEVGQTTSKKDAKLLSREARNKVASTAFPYVASQARLLQEFRVERPSRCTSPVLTAQQETAQPLVVPLVDPPPPPAPEPQGNNGLGNGGEGSEGPEELGNPGQGKLHKKQH
jgi:hypothetical protein